MLGFSLDQPVPVWVCALFINASQHMLHPSAGDYTIAESQSYDPVIAAVPMMVLVGLTGFLSLYLFRQAAAWIIGGGSQSQNGSPNQPLRPSALP